MSCQTIEECQQIADAEEMSMVEHMLEYHPARTVLSICERSTYEFAVVDNDGYVVPIK